MKNIFFTGGGGAGNAAIWNFLHKKYNLFFGDADFHSIDPNINYSNRFKLPWCREKTYLSKLVYLCKKLKIDYLVPGIDEELILICQNKKKFGKTKIFLPNLNFIKRTQDKFYMSQLFIKKKISVPRTFLFKDFDLKEKNINYVLKPRKGRGSREVFFIKTKNELNSFKLNKKYNSENYIIQDEIKGLEFTVQMLLDSKKKLLNIVPVLIDKKKGITISGSVSYNKKIISLCKKIHNFFPEKNVYNVQLVYNKFENKAYVIEINPRISTTFCLSLALGIDPFSKMKKIIKNKKKITLKRYWKNCFYEN
tara:strand:+ start:604 stop:1527 length:924 start_codon:yes stop_codon:yes gene_type:complete